MLHSSAGEPCCRGFALSRYNERRVSGSVRTVGVCRCTGTAVAALKDAEIRLIDVVVAIAIEHIAPFSPRPHSRPRYAALEFTKIVLIHITITVEVSTGSWTHHSHGQPKALVVIQRSTILV